MSPRLLWLCPYLIVKFISDGLDYGFWFGNIAVFSKNLPATIRLLDIVGIIWPRKCLSAEFH
jgi:hypothetical protein